MDPCGKTISSITDDLKEPSCCSIRCFFENHQGKMNDSISETEINGCDLEQSNEIATNQMTAKVTTNIMIPSTTKAVNSSCMKMSGHRVIASTDLFYWTLTKTR